VPLTRLGLSNPVAVAVGCILLVIFGLLSLSRLPVQMTPNIDRPTISVSTSWRAAAPSEVAKPGAPPQSGAPVLQTHRTVKPSPELVTGTESGQSQPVVRGQVTHTPRGRSFEFQAPGLNLSQARPLPQLETRNLTPRAKRSAKLETPNPTGLGSVWPVVSEVWSCPSAIHAASTPRRTPAPAQPAGAAKPYRGDRNGIRRERAGNSGKPRSAPHSGDSGHR